MKNNLYKVLVALIVFGLVACQTATVAPAENLPVEFFQNQPARWISVKPPAGWEAHPGGTSSSPSVIVTDDWKGYSSTNTRAVGIVILPLTDKGAAGQVLQLAVNRLQKMLTKPIGQVLVEQVEGQSYASIEYEGTSAEVDNAPAYYFFAVISTNTRNVLVFASVDPDQVERVRPAYKSTLKAITLH